MSGLQDRTGQNKTNRKTPGKRIAMASMIIRGPRMGFEKSKTLHQNYNNQRVDAVIGGRACHFRSKGEHNLAVYFQFLKEQSEIVSWEYESKRCQKYFPLPPQKKGASSWLIDFAVEMPDGEIVYWEYKGWLQGRDVTKFRRFAQCCHDDKVILVMSGKAKKDANRLRQIRKYAYRILYARDLFKPVRGLLGFI